jgi:phosphopantetheinyl transferase
VASQEQCVVKVWRAQPDCIGAAQWRALARLLDAAELAQAARFCFVADHRAYVLAHGLRRLALAHLLDLPSSGAAGLRFGQDGAGRPFRVEPVAQHSPKRSACRWFFSHAHAREGVLFAACREHPVGVDIEATARHAPDSGLLRRYLDWPQQQGQHELELDWDSASGFAEGWTALEAFVKALGCGLRGLGAVQSRAPVRCTTPSLRTAERHALGLSFRLSLQSTNELTCASVLRRHHRREALVLRPIAPPGCAAALAVRQGRQALPPRLDEYRLDTDAALLGRLC